MDQKTRAQRIEDVDGLAEQIEDIFYKTIGTGAVEKDVLSFTDEETVELTRIVTRLCAGASSCLDWLFQCKDDERAEKNSVEATVEAQV
jgi:hypothetical protein